MLCETHNLSETPLISFLRAVLDFGVLKAACVSNHQSQLVWVVGADGVLIVHRYQRLSHMGSGHRACCLCGHRLR
jgi:hypothetical protein